MSGGQEWGAESGKDSEWVYEGGWGLLKGSGDQRFWVVATPSKEPNVPLSLCRRALVLCRFSLILFTALFCSRHWIRLPDWDVLYIPPKKGTSAKTNMQFFWRHFSLVKPVDVNACLNASLLAYIYFSSSCFQGQQSAVSGLAFFYCPFSLFLSDSFLMHISLAQLDFCRLEWNLAPPLLKLSLQLCKSLSLNYWFVCFRNPVLFYMSQMFIGFIGWRCSIIILKHHCIGKSVLFCRKWKHNICFHL